MRKAAEKAGGARRETSRASEAACELAFLEGEAKVASAFAPEGMAVGVKAGGADGRFDVLFGGAPVATYLARGEALACILGVGGALAVLAACRAKRAAARAEGVVVVDRRDPGWRKRFRSRSACRAWLLEGYAGTDGAEREHFAGMMAEFDGGASVLHYN